MAWRARAGARRLATDVVISQCRGGGRREAAASELGAIHCTQMAVAGFLATALGDLIIAPIDTIKTLQQGSGGASLSMLSATRQKTMLTSSRRSSPRTRASQSFGGLPTHSHATHIMRVSETGRTSG